MPLYSATKQVQPSNSEDLLADKTICYAANAVSGRGGQGEFLRQMVYAFEGLAQGRVLSRRSSGIPAHSINIAPGWRSKYCGGFLRRVPVLRRRGDWITLVDDIDFDSGLLPHLSGVDLLDGVMGQCCEAFRVLSRRNAALTLTALNCHIDDVALTLHEEHRRLGVHTPSFVHPGMRRRVQEELARAARIRVISEYAKASFVARGFAAEKIEVILPAVDLDHFKPVPKADNVFRVLAVLTIDPRKGAYYLLQAFEKAAIPNSELVIIGATGDPWSRQMLESFRHRLPNLKIQSANVLTEPVEKTYGQGSVFVHPALEDGFALAVGQAFACGLPVITTRQTGASQLIREGVNGFVLEARDVDGIVDRLRLLASNESLRQRLSAAAPEAVAHLGYPAVADRVLSFYRRALSA